MDWDTGAKWRVKAAEAVEAMDPGGETAGAIAEDGVGRQMFAQPDHDFAEIDCARLWHRRVGESAIVGIGGAGLVAPRRFGARAAGDPAQRRKRWARRGWQGAAETPGRSPRRRDRPAPASARSQSNRRVVLRRDLVQPRPATITRSLCLIRAISLGLAQGPGRRHNWDASGRTEARGDSRWRPAGRSVRQSGRSAARAVLVPAAAAEHQQGRCGLGQQRLPVPPSRPRRARFPAGSTRARRCSRPAAASMSRGSASTTGPGRPAIAVERRGRHIRPCARHRRSRPSIWSCCRTRRDNPFPAHASRPLKRRSTWPTNRIIGVESCWAIWTPAAALVAPGPRVTKQMPGRPVALPWASAIIAAPPSWRQTVTAMPLSDQRIQHRQIAFARHAEDVAHASAATS